MAIRSHLDVHGGKIRAVKLDTFGSEQVLLDTNSTRYLTDETHPDRWRRMTIPESIAFNNRSRSVLRHAAANEIRHRQEIAASVPDQADPIASLQATTGAQSSYAFSSGNTSSAFTAALAKAYGTGATTPATTTSVSGTTSRSQQGVTAVKTKTPRTGQATYNRSF